MLFVGIDIGGTFTDLALYDSDSEELRVHKVRSTPDDPGRALVEGVARAVRARGGGHGRTSTACSTARRSRRTRCSSTTAHRPAWSRPPACATWCTSGAISGPSPTRSCRTSPGSRAVRPAPSTGSACPSGSRRRPARPWSSSTRRPCARPARTLREAGVEAVAVCFLFSYLEPGARAARAARSLPRRCPTASSPRAPTSRPQFREFERFTTACMNAFVGPGTGQYLRAPGRGARRPRRGGETCS